MDGIPGSTLTGPFPVGQYAAAVASKRRLYLVGYSKLYALIRRGGERGR
jgi:hypothetical protein